MSLQVVWNQGATFGPGVVTDLPFPATFGPEQSVYDIQAIDVNFDGRKDLVVAYQNSVALGGWELQVLVNQGGRTFADGTAQNLPNAASRTGGFPSASSPESRYWVQFIQPADLNGDGRMDFTLDARGPTSAPAAMPVAYIHQADGSFASVNVGELAGAASRWVFDYTTQFVSWNAGTGFAHLGFNNGTVSLDVLPVTFAPILPLRTDLVTTSVVRNGTAAADQLAGGTKNDTLTGGAGNDMLDGGSGVDTAVFSGARSAYSVTATGTGWTVMHTGGGSDGTDTLVSVERLKFSDVRLALDTGGNGGMAFRLYQAAFNRTPDPSGLGFQMNTLDQGASIFQVAANFIISPEFQRTYGTLNDAQFVTQLYQNVLHRAPDTDGLAYHTKNLGAGVARAEVLVGFSESPENQAALIGTIQNGMVYTL